MLPPTPLTPSVAKDSAQQTAVGRQDPAWSVGVGGSPFFSPSYSTRAPLNTGGPYLLGKGKRGKINLSHFVPPKLLFKC